MSTGTAENASASSTSSSAASAASPASSPVAAAPGGSPSASSPAASSSSPDSALAALERVAAASAEVAPSPTSPDAAGEGSPPASTELTTQAPAAPIPRSTDAPENRIQSAVRNARADTRAEMEQELGWARTLGSKEDVSRAVDLTRRLFSNPQAFFEQLGQELNQGKPVPEEELLDPKPDLRSEDGKLAFSHEANIQIARNAAERMRRELRKEFDPALKYAQNAEQAAAQQAVIREASDTASEVMAAARQLPHFTNHEKEIGAVLRAIDPAVRKKVGSVAALYMAYNKVLADQVLPTLSTTTQRQTIADLQRSAHAGANGHSAAPATVKPPVVRDGNVDDLAKLLERKHAEAAAQH